MTHHQRSQLQRDRAMDVLRVLRPDQPGMGISEIAECALGLNTEPKRRKVRAAIDYIVYEFHVRIRRRRPGKGLATVYWVEPQDATAREAVLNLTWPGWRRGRPEDVIAHAAGQNGAGK